jgi:hypothetical protein
MIEATEEYVMNGKKSTDFRVDPALRAVIEDAIAESLERSPHLAEGITQVDPELRREMIATAAYHIAEQRGFAPGHEQDDWYRAEAAVDRQLARMLAQD